MFIAGIVGFNVFFAILYTLKWKYFYCCKKEYKINAFNLEKTFHKLRNEQNDEGHSTDDEEIYETAKRIYLAQ